MREILFRGKEVADGKWNEGFYSAEEYNPYSGEVEHIPRIQIIGKCVSLGVIPETVGQYTGLTDKNGVRIFEGDIVRYAERRRGGEDVSVAFPVTFDEGGFCAHHYFLNNWLRNGLGGNTKLEDIEVIGNIHDNPELLQKI